MCLKIDWASLIFERKFTVFLCFTLYLRAISKYKPPGELILEGRFNGGFFALGVWTAYIWRGFGQLIFYDMINELCTWREEDPRRKNDFLGLQAEILVCVVLK